METHIRITIDFTTDYLDKIEDCTGGNEWESQTWSFPEEFFTRLKNEIKNERIENIFTRRVQQVSPQEVPASV